MLEVFKTKRNLYILIALFLLMILGGYVAIKKIFFSELEAPVIKDKGNQEEATFATKRINLLLLAVDARQGETNSRTDTIIVASIDTEKKDVVLLSIPRDTKAKIEANNIEYYDKINSANSYGGVDLTKKTVEELLQIPIHYYVLTNFSGFIEIVDVLGGVTVDVEKKMYYKGEGINLKKGIQTLDGKKALQYVRFRSDSEGDIGRTARQQKFLKAVLGEALQVKNIAKIPELVRKLNKSIDTDLSLTDMTKLATFAHGLDRRNIITQTLPGNFTWYRGLSYWGINEERIPLIVYNLLEKGQQAETIDESVPFTTRKQSLMEAGMLEAEVKEEELPPVAEQNEDAVNEDSPIKEGEQKPIVDKPEEEPKEEEPKEDSEEDPSVNDGVY